ncbi:MAG TPA: PRC-barrel domain-containing protein [Burkholderiales bacterium]
MLAALLAPPIALAAGWIRMPASELLGKPVIDMQGDRLGRVQDLVVDVRNSRVSYAIVGFNGWGTLGEELFPVPLKSLAPEPGGSRVTLQVAPRTLRDGASIDAQSEPRLPADAPLKQHVRASELVGRRVSDRTGTHAGEIEEAVIDMNSGLVLFLLFDYDEAWGLDQPALRMAPQAFSFPADGGPAVVNVARERLEDPGR